MVRFLIPAFSLSLIAGYCVGAAAAAWMVYPSAQVKLVDDAHISDTPVVRIDGIRNGALIGSVSGDVRVVAGSTPVALGGSGAFAIIDRSVLTNIIEIHVPPGMKFVASKKGTKYYPVGSASANSLSPTNRIYFPTAAAAERAGYKK